MKNILFVNQDTVPYVEETELSVMGKAAPCAMQQLGNGIRTFMPRWGNINERRWQLHEVIRLSGQNIKIKGMDHPTVIKVATIHGTKVQVYFIDNDEFFSYRRAQTVDPETGKEFADNGERAVFFARGVVETLKKLRWIPDVIHCQGWMTSLVPMYIRKAYAEDPAVAGAKIVTSLFGETFRGNLEKDFKSCVTTRGVDRNALSAYEKTFDALELSKVAVDFSDGVILASENVAGDIADYVRQSGKKTLGFPGEDFAADYMNFYETL